MSNKLPSREQAIQLLFENNCSATVVKHCLAVSELAVETAGALKKKGLSVDSELVEIGALLHDIGRARTHSVNHVIEGAKISESLGLPKPIVHIIERHAGGGITPSEAELLGWPKRDSYIPVSLEEKIVSYADKLIDGCCRVSVELTISQFSKKGLDEAAKKIRKLHDEIVMLLGDCS